MNQTPAAILILTSSILAYSATTGTTAITTTSAGVTTHTSPVGVILGLGALVLGIWGIISLIGASIRDRELAFEGTTRTDLLAMFDPRRMGRPYAAAAPHGTAVAPRTGTAADPSAIALTPEMKAQLSMAAHLEGRERSQIVEEALRRYLPSYENTKAA